MITIYRATRHNGRAFVSSWHSSADAAWREIHGARKEPKRAVIPIRGPSVEPIHVILTRDGILRALNNYAKGGEAS